MLLKIPAVNNFFCRATFHLFTLALRLLNLPRVIAGKRQRTRISLSDTDKCVNLLTRKFNVHLYFSVLHFICCYAK